MLNMIYFAILVVVIGMAQADPSKLPTTISPCLLERDDSMSATTCPANDMIEQEIKKTKDYFNKNHRFRPCGCGSSDWTRVALYNYSIHECPEGTIRKSITDPNTQQVITGCVHNINGLNIKTVTVPIPVKGVRYSTVCGRILGWGLGYAFVPFIYLNSSIESRYISGVSLTHGPPCNRKHIWSFVAAYVENNNATILNCLCSNTKIPWPYQTPWDVGQDYFCDTNVVFDGIGYHRDHSDLLWDGHGCTPSSSCCSFNSPPYFCKKLDYTTNEDIDMRWTVNYLKSWMTTFAEIYIK